MSSSAVPIEDWDDDTNVVEVPSLGSKRPAAVDEGDDDTIVVGEDSPPALKRRAVDGLETCTAVVTKQELPAELIHQGSSSDAAAAARGIPPDHKATEADDDASSLLSDALSVLSDDLSVYSEGFEEDSLGSDVDFEDLPEPQGTISEDEMDVGEDLEPASSSNKGKGKAKGKKKAEVMFAPRIVSVKRRPCEERRAWPDSRHPHLDWVPDEYKVKLTVEGNEVEQNIRLGKYHRCLQQLGKHANLNLEETDLDVFGFRQDAGRILWHLWDRWQQEWAWRTDPLERNVSHLYYFSFGLLYAAAKEDYCFPELLGIVFRGFSMEVQRLLGSENWDDLGTRLLALPDDIDNTHYMGIYVGLVSHNNVVEGVYVGHSYTTVRDRWMHHRSNTLIGKRSPFYNLARQPDRITTFRVLALYPDDTPKMILYFAESMLISYFDTFPETGRYNAGIGAATVPFCKWMRSHMSQSFSVLGLNRSFPTIESFSGRVSVPCENCGNSNFLRRQHGLVKQKVKRTKGSDKLLCANCRNFVWLYGYERPMAGWMPYLWTKIPACRFCGDMTPETLKRKKDKEHETSFEESFTCLPCKRKHRRACQYLWKPYLRPMFLCQLCGKAEHDPGANVSVKLKICRNKRERTDPVPLLQGHRLMVVCTDCDVKGPPGETGQQCTERTERFWWGPRLNDGLHPTEMGAAPPEVKDIWEAWLARAGQGVW